MMVPELIQQLVALTLALFGFSYLIFKENRFFAFSEQMQLGAITLVGLVTSILNLRTPIGNIMSGRIALIIPLILGFTAFTRLTRYRWIVRYSVAILAGVGVGIAFGLTIKSEIVTSLGNLISGAVTGKDILSGIIKLVCGFGVLFYFLYSAKYSTVFHTGRFSYLARIGRAFIMIYLGFGFLNEFVANVAYERIFFTTILKRALLRIFTYATQ